MPGIDRVVDLLDFATKRPLHEGGHSRLSSFWYGEGANSFVN